MKLRQIIYTFSLYCLKNYIQGSLFSQIQHSLVIHFQNINFTFFQQPFFVSILLFIAQYKTPKYILHFFRHNGVNVQYEKKL